MGQFNLNYNYYSGLSDKALTNDGEAIWDLVMVQAKLNAPNYGDGNFLFPIDLTTVIGHYLADNFDEGDAGYTDSKWHNVEGSTNIIDLLDKIQNGDTAKTKELFKMVDMDIKYNKEPLQVTPYYSFKEAIDQCRNIAERKAKEEAERKAKEEAERKAKEEAERIAKEEAERKAKEEAERKAKEEAERIAKEEAERKAKEEAERKAKEEAERIAKEEAERKAKEEAERKAKEEAERIAKEEAERKAKEEAERKAKEEAERIAKEEAERIAKEEAERKAKEEAERKVKEEAERKAKEEIKEEAERNSYKSLIEDFVSDIKECEYKDGIIFGKKKKIHYVANPITKRIWNAVVNKSSEADFDDNDFVPQKELGTFLENLNSYYSGKIVFEYLHKNIHALVHLQVYEKQDKNACFVYIKEEN
ncbi:hypothetical protein [uncultured Prevotella sp.]|uniref:hypothetical protein n=2 Tax=uncultured Prevotella sp. TaxID=159272 RepID=UPI0025E3163D|nr:hypothetical protein [uncultured Prevotella sp.]